MNSGSVRYHLGPWHVYIYNLQASTVGSPSERRSCSSLGANLLDAWRCFQHPWQIMLTLGWFTQKLTHSANMLIGASAGRCAFHQPDIPSLGHLAPEACTTATENHCVHATRPIFRSPVTGFSLELFLRSTQIKKLPQNPSFPTPNHQKKNQTKIHPNSHPLLFPASCLAISRFALAAANSALALATTSPSLAAAAARCARSAASFSAAASAAAAAASTAAAASVASWAERTAFMAAWESHRVQDFTRTRIRDDNKW